MQTTVAKGVAMSKFCSDPNKKAIFFIFMKVLIEKIFEYDQGENKDHIQGIFQIWQNLLFYRKILCKTTCSLLNPPEWGLSLLAPNHVCSVFVC